MVSCRDMERMRAVQLQSEKFVSPLPPELCAPLIAAVGWWVYLDMNTGLLTAIASRIEKPCISKCSCCAISHTIASVLLIPVALVTRKNLRCKVQYFTATDLSMWGLPVRVFEADYRFLYNHDVPISNIRVPDLFTKLCNKSVYCMKKATLNENWCDRSISHATASILLIAFVTRNNPWKYSTVLQLDAIDLWSYLNQAYRLVFP